MEELLTVTQVADYLQQKDYVIRRKLRKGEIKGIKLSGRDWRIKRSALEEYLNIGGNDV